MPFGFGKGGGRGRGAGRGAGGKGRGRRFMGDRAENCICPACGTIVTHQRGRPCFQRACPSCGSVMTRQFGPNVASATLAQTTAKSMVPKIDPELCTGCGQCVIACPVDVISIIDEKAVIDENRCNRCRACVPVCPKSAIS